MGLKVPSYRVDVKREADIIEEILRVYGYNNISFTDKLNTSIFHVEFDREHYVNTLSEQLVALGFYETMSNSLTKPEYINLDDKLKEAHHVTMLNPLSSDLESMRQSMTFSLLENIAYNINRKNDSTRFFEWGKTYYKYPDGYSEQEHLALAVTGKHIERHWQAPEQPTDFFYLKGVLQSIFERTGLQNLSTKPLNSSLFTDGLAFVRNGKTYATLGAVHPKALKAFGVKQAVIFADIKTDILFEHLKTHEVSVKDLPKFPSVKRDLALLVDKNTSFEMLYNTSFKAEKKLLKAVDLFDVYEGKNLPEGKKSYAMSFVLRDDTKTLRDKLIDKTMNRIFSTLKHAHGVELRQ